jgi:hypothetical protein
MAEGRVCGGILSQKIFEIWSPEMPFPAFWASKFALKFMLTIIVIEIKLEGKTHKKQKIKPKTYFPFIYLLFFVGLFV